MSDKIRVSGECRDKHGNVSVQCITITERDSEVIPEEDKRLSFILACYMDKFEPIGPITTEYL